MVELDTTLRPLADLTNSCCDSLFPECPRSPRFSFVRAMATVWKEKVYDKLRENLCGAFAELLDREREGALASGKQMMSESRHTKKCQDEDEYS